MIYTIIQETLHKKLRKVRHLHSEPAALYKIGVQPMLQPKTALTDFGLQPYRAPACFNGLHPTTATILYWHNSSTIQGISSIVKSQTCSTKVLIRQHSFHCVINYNHISVKTDLTIFVIHRDTAAKSLAQLSRRLFRSYYHNSYNWHYWLV